MMDEPLTVCPECQGSIRRVLFPAGIVFKGSGFYKTDHGNGGVISSESKPEAKNGTGEAAAAKTEEEKSSAGEKGKKSSEAQSGSGEKSGEKAGTPAAKSESSAAAAAD